MGVSGSTTEALEDYVDLGWLLLEGPGGMAPPGM